jgi:hypothetical protein
MNSDMAALDRRELLLALFCLGASSLPGYAAEGDKAGRVPRSFRQAYEELQAELEAFERYLRSRPARRRDVVFGGEVLPANSHRGEDLLNERAHRGSVLFIERLKALGAGGVSIQGAYPLLSEDYPRSNEYWAFYRRLAQAVRERGLKLHVKSGPLFTEKEFTKVRTDYSKLTPDRYFGARAQIAQRIAEEISPDYLTIANEPSSEMHILKFAITSQRYTRFVNDTLKAMRRSRTLVGAGSGNWDAPDYIRAFANETSLDYIDIHIYPVANPYQNYLQRAVEMATVARAARKRVIIGEAWLYKASRGELRGNPTAASVFGRDVYGFWAPLDVKFLEILQRLGQTEQIEYISPFWTKYLFAYVDFEQAPAFANPRQLLALGDQAAVKPLIAGNASESGEAYRRIVRGTGG